MIRNKFATKSLDTSISSLETYNDLFVLYGSINKTVVVSSIKIIESKLKVLGYSKTLVSKAKLISVELLDNILKHQLNDASLSPFFEVVVNKSELKFTSGNCISKNNYLYLDEKLKEYSLMSQDGVQDKYMKRLKTGGLDDKGNAGLGILTILKRSAKKYKYIIEPLDNDEYYFNSCVNIYG